MSLAMWWPAPEAIQDLVVTDCEGGFELSAPEETECANWLSYWSQSPLHVKFFSEEFVSTLLSYLESLNVQS
jgi:hypothetical protein